MRYKKAQNARPTPHSCNQTPLPAHTIRSAPLKRHNHTKMNPLQQISQPGPNPSIPRTHTQSAHRTANPIQCTTSPIPHPVKEAI